MSTKERTAEELKAAWLTIAAAAIDRPAELLLAMLDQLVEVACGTNPALKDHMRLQFYRGVLAKLEAVRRDGDGEIEVPEKLLRSGAAVIHGGPDRGGR